MKRFYFALLLVSAILIGCNEDNDNQPEPNPQLTIDSKPSFIGTIDGNLKSYDDKNSVSIQGSGGGIVPAPDTSKFTYDSQLGSLDFERGYIMIELGTLKIPNGGLPEDEDFFNFFVVGQIPYSKGYIDGIEIRYWDENNKEWNTSFSNGDQESNTFTFSGLRKEYLNSLAIVKYKADFSCTLYDEEGNSIVLSNGVYVNYFFKM
jgi:hypothetical protein